MREYRTNVTVVIDDNVRDCKIDPDVLKSLTESGLVYTDYDVKQELGVVEGVICSQLVHDLKKIKGVAYVREQGTYLSTDEPCSE